MPGMRLHDSHGALHAELQHTPSTQRADWQAAPASQLAPLTRRGTQRYPWQEWPAAQSVLVTQLFGQRSSSPEHTYGLQDGEPGCPAGASRQVPSEPAMLQRSHAPVHSSSQQ